jgi:hypothetical protein
MMKSIEPERDGKRARRAPQTARESKPRLPDAAAELPPGVSRDAWPVYAVEPRPYCGDDAATRARRADPALQNTAARRTAVSLGRQVHAVRTARGLTQEQAAALLGWDQPQWARLEAGRVYPTLATLDLLATRLGVRIVLTPDVGGLLVTLEEVAPAA